MDLPNKIFEKIKSIFVPDTEKIKSKIDSVKIAFNDKFNMNIDFSAFFGEATLPENAKIKFNEVEYTILDYGFINTYYQNFKGFIRALFAIFIVYINIRNFNTLIGQGGSANDN